MSLREVRWAPVVLVLVLTVGLLLGINRYYQKLHVETPLGQVMQAHPEVKEWYLTKDQKGDLLTVKLGPVDNLLETCNTIQKESEPYLGKEGWQFHVDDQRSEELEQVYYSIQYAVYEALAQGSFTNLTETLKAESEKARLDHYAIYVNNYHLFVQMQKGENNLYEILPRMVNDKPPVMITGGSEQ